MSAEMEFDQAGSYLVSPSINRWRFIHSLAGAVVGHADRIRWIGSAVFAVAAHAAVAASFMLEPEVKVATAPPPAAVQVDLVAPPSSNEAVATATPIGPDQIQAEAQPEPTPEQIDMPKFEPPPLERITDIDPVVLQKIDPKPNLPRPTVQQKVADRTTARPTNVATPNDVAAAPRTGAPSVTASDAEQSWEQRIMAQLEREKRYPSEARSQGMEDYVTVRFVIDRQGRVLSARIVHSNGFAPLDQEALAVFHRVTLAPLPEQVKGQTFDRQVRLHFFSPRHG
jgi:periplasmic protein TonB